MSKKHPCYLKRRNFTYPSKKSFLERLKEIRDSDIQSSKRYIENLEYILDLKDFLEDFYCDEKRILSSHNIETCKFFVQKSPNYATNCIYIETDEHSNDFSTTKFQAPSEESKFSQACSYILIPRKLEIKKEEMKKQGLDVRLNDYELIHKFPTWREIIELFIKKNDLNEVLNEVVSDDKEGNNAPVFKNEYKYLKQAFLDFYDSLDLEYELRG